MQPYQEATEEALRKGKQPIETAKKAVIAGISFAGGIGFNKIASKVAPFLSQYISPELAKKGISKIDPALGKFINKSEQAGYDFDEIKQFLGEKISGQERKQPEQQKNVIEQYSPELHQFMKQQVTGGRPVLEAGAIAQNDKRFKSAIDKLSKDHKTNWSNIIQGIYGSGEQAQPSQTQEQPQQMQPQQQGSGQGQQALMAILQELKKSRGG